MQWSLKRTQRIDEKIALVEMMAVADFEPEIIEERIAYLMRGIRTNPKLASSQNMWKEFEFIRLCEFFHRMSLAIRNGPTTRPYWSLYQEILWDMHRMLLQQRKRLQDQGTSDKTVQQRRRRRSKKVKLPSAIAMLHGK